jgi:hypothetical protein
MQKHETLIKVLKEEKDGVWVLVRLEKTGKTIKVFYPK